MKDNNSNTKIANDISEPNTSSLDSNLEVDNLSEYTLAAQQDFISSLPRTTTAFYSKHFSGYLSISSTKNLHYYFIESENNVNTDPVMFWTNGGPGCSGMIGLFTEFGPWRPIRDNSLIRNPFTWSRNVSLVILEQPVGVGFSYTTNPSELNTVSDQMASQDNLQAIKVFYKKFPQRRSNPLILASESYGGHYIPQWTLAVLDDSEFMSTINFAGFMLGNPYVNFASLDITMAEMLWGRQMIPQNLWDIFIHNGCDNYNANMFSYSNSCYSILNQIVSYANLFNPYALDFPVCVNPSNLYDYHVESERTTQKTSSQVSQLLEIRRHYNRESKEKYVDITIDGIVSPSKREREVSTPKISRKRLDSKKLQDIYYPGGTITFATNFSYDPCTEDYNVNYLNDLNVQKALHVVDNQATKSKEWLSCNNAINLNWPRLDWTANTIPLFSRIAKHSNKPEGFKMLVYSGDTDGVCGTSGTQKWVYDVENTTLEELWLQLIDDNGQLGGYVTMFTNNFTFATIRFAGHEVPAYQPGRSLLLLQYYLDGELFYRGTPIKYRNITLPKESMPTNTSNLSPNQPNDLQVSQSILITIITTIGSTILVILLYRLYKGSFISKTTRTADKEVETMEVAVSSIKL